MNPRFVGISPARRFRERRGDKRIRESNERVAREIREIARRKFARSEFTRRRSLSREGTNERARPRAVRANYREGGNDTLKTPLFHAEKSPAFVGGTRLNNAPLKNISRFINRRSSGSATDPRQSRMDFTFAPEETVDRADTVNLVRKRASRLSFSCVCVCVCYDYGADKVRILCGIGHRANSINESQTTSR